jgi:ketosteroid isomerase-like protein
MIMPTRRALCAMLLAGGSHAARSHPHDEPASIHHASIEKVILETREAIILAARNKDAAALRALYAPSFVHTNAVGASEGRDARIADLLGGRPTIETAPARDLHVHVHPPGAAIATGRSRVDAAGNARGATLRWTQLFANNGTGWRLAASQETRLAAERD